MIRFVHGALREKFENFIIVEAGGIGYGIHVPATALSALPGISEEVMIYTYFRVNSQDGSMDLFGFLTPEDREMFTMLLSVNGVGPKAAMGVLSVISPDDLRMAIVTSDAKAISRAPGVGSKTAQRIVLELKDKLDAQAVFNTALEHGSTGNDACTPVLKNTAKDAVDALIALGYTAMEANRAVQKVAITEDMTVNQILKASLKNLNTLG